MAFTEQGVAMLSGVLQSPRAVAVNIAIMRAFVRLRRLLVSDEALSRQVADLEARIERQDGRIESVWDAMQRLMEPEEGEKSRIGFKPAGD